MTNRITDAHLDARVETINSLLGHGRTPAYSTVGAVTLRKAYGSTGVDRYVNDAGGVRNLSDLGTKREAYIFLSGMIEAAYALDPAYKF